MNWQQFEDPSAAFRLQPFWFWNGEMEDEQMKRQIEEMAHKGVGGFFICPRQGLKIPYLSEAWFEKVRTAVEIAKQHELEVWLYDEYPYPSGIAGGEVVLEHPEAKHYSLVHRTERVSGGTKLTLELPWARILSAKAVPVSASGKKLWDQAIDVRHTIGNYQADPIFQKSGLTAYNQKRFFTYRTIYTMMWDVPPGEWEVIIFLEEEIEDFKYYGTFVDPCNHEAMETFIRMTHDKYAYYVGEYFGKTIKGMFTDEIGLLGETPWSKQLPDYFKERTGLDMKDSLEALVYPDSPDAAKFRYEYYQSIHLLLRESYHKQVFDWCERYGLQYVTEVPSVRMTTQLHSHMPGGDSAHEKLGRSLEWILNKYTGKFRNGPKMVSSLARQLGRERNLIECFHSVGWSMTLQDAKWMIDNMAALGTNFYNFHAFFYTVDGLAQHDAPPSQFLQNPYWEHFRQLGDYTGRISWFMSQGKADIRIAVLDPTTTLWAHMGNPFQSFNIGAEGVDKERLERLRQDWRALGVQLLLNRRDFDHLDPELLADADVSDGTISLGYANYEVLIIPPVTNLEAGAWHKIQAFANNGGIVIALGLLPHDQIEDESPTEQEAAALFGVSGSPQEKYWGRTEAAQLSNQESWTKGEHNAFFISCAGNQPFTQTMQSLLALLDHVSPAAVRLTTQGKDQPFLMQVRELSKHSGAAFITNQEGSFQATELLIDMNQLGWLDTGTVETAADFEFRLLDLETGKSHPIAAELHDGEWKLSLSFEPFESRLVEWTEAANRQPTASNNQLLTSAEPTKLLIPLEGPWEVEAFADNEIRFDTFRLTMGTESDSNSLPGYVVQAKTFIDQCDDLAKEREFPIAFGSMFGTPLKLSMAYPIACSYSAVFQVEQMPQACQLFMDESAISGNWTLLINGHSMTRTQFTHHEIYDHQNIECDILAYLQQGFNEIVVNLQVQHDWDGIVDALYIRGPFGVGFDQNGSPLMLAAPSEISVLPEAYCPGYPYYAGTLAYKRKLEFSEVPSGTEVELNIGSWEQHDTVELFVNGQSLGVRPWSPYTWSCPSSILSLTGNEIELRVTGTLIGLLEGKYFNYKTHSLESVASLPKSSSTGSPPR
ncbi:MULTISPECIES: glycosyl hydrolase [unclassified Paenibacillus]|uniref:glycosyl hydrolase n=1 Tax=unclassified Paenibacillus TaxID=185978 RepID=UPI0036275934